MKCISLELMQAVHEDCFRILNSPQPPPSTIDHREGPGQSGRGECDPLQKVRAPLWQFLLENQLCSWSWSMPRPDLCLGKPRDSCWLMAEGEADPLPACYFWEFFRAKMWVVTGENAGQPGFKQSGWVCRRLRTTLGHLQRKRTK